jgi:hypothetical protein
MIYKTKREKFEAVIEEIEELAPEGQPVLVGTISIDVSEELSQKLKKRGIPHEVLNAKNHEKEAEIVAMAGQRGAVTISTNMAGRGTDIVLGEGVTELGGLHIIGTERTRAAASTTSCGAAPAGRGTRAPRAFTWPWRTICCGSSAASGSPGSWKSSGWRTASPSSTP